MRNKLHSQKKTDETKKIPAVTDAPISSWEMSAQAALRVDYVTSAQYNAHKHSVPAGS